jgi:hypothetical protein
MSTGAAPKEVLPLTPDQKPIVAKVASTSMMVAAVLLLLGLIQIVGGPLWWLWGSATLLSAFLTLFQGVITVLLGMVMLAVSTDFRFLAEYPKFAGNHLRNAANNLKVFYQMQLALVLLLALVIVIRLVA